MSILEAIILGIIQGLSEFLPISSSGHLVLLQQVFGIDEGSLFFTIMLHVGTLIAVLIVYRALIWRLIKAFFICFKLLFTGKKAELGSHMRSKDVHLLLMMLVSTLATTILALVFNDLIDEASGGAFLGFSFLLTSIVLLLMNIATKKTYSTSKLKVLPALGIGLAQGVAAILPGLSRSGSTIAGARLFGLKKKSAAEYSFLLSIPAICGAVIIEVPDAIENGIAGDNIAAIIIGVIFAAVTGFLAIKFMLKLIANKSLNIFAVYTSVRGVLVVLDQLVFNLVFENPFIA